MNFEIIADAAAAEPPGGILPSLFFLGALIAVNAFFAASEIAVISLNDAKIRKMAEQGDGKAKMRVRFLDEPGRFLATIQVGITLAGFLASAFAADTFAEHIVSAFRSWGVTSTAVRPAAVFLITVILSFASLVLGELVPKRIAMQHSELVSMRSARILAGVARVMRPFVWLLTAATNSIVRLLGLNPQEKTRTVSEEEIRMMVDVGREKGVIEADEKEMINNVFDFNNKTASDLMVHRKDIEAIDIDAPRAEIENTLKTSVFSRLPVYKETIDDVVGILNVRDYFIKSLDEDSPDIQSILRRPFCVFESVRADVLLKDMQRSKQSIAVVLDEYGGTSGIITLEDLLEEIVGDIYDEYDEVEEPSEWEKLDDGSYRIRGATSIQDVSELLAMDLPVGDYHTLGGMIFGRLGVIPSSGSVLKLPEAGLLFTVEKMDGRRVDSVLVRRVARLKPAQQ